MFAREQTSIWMCANTWMIATIRAYVGEQTLVALKEACIILLLRIKNLQNFSAKWKISVSLSSENIAVIAFIHMVFSNSR